MTFRPGALLCRMVLMAACLAAALGFVVLTLRFPGLVVLALLGIAWVTSRQWRGSGWAFGQARFASWLDAYFGGLFAERGPILGRASLLTPPSRSQAIRMLFRPLVPSVLAVRMFFAAFGRSRREGDCLLRPSSYTHLMTCAPTGAGKGVSVIVPTLLAESSLAGIVVTDPKGENFRLTSDARRRHGHRVLRLDPFGLCGPDSDTLNPLDFIDEKSPEFIEQVRGLANALVLRTGQEKEPHWNDSAEIVLTAAIAFVCVTEKNREERNLQLVREIVSSRDKFMKMRDTMQKMKDLDGLLSRLGGMLSWYVEEELGSVLSTVQRHTAFLDSPLVAANTKRSSFDPKVLRSGATLYLILPHDRLTTLAGLQRLWVTSVLRRVAEGVPSERSPVLFILDEFAHQGRIAAIEDALTLMRGMGVKIWIFVQSIAQLRTCYGEKADTILDNIGTQQYFAINAVESAEYLSKRMGDETIVLENLNRTTSRSRPEEHGRDGSQRSVSTSTSVTYSETGRRLLKLEEVLQLPSDFSVVYHGRLPPVAVRLLRYFDAPEFRRGRLGVSRGLGLAAGVWCLFALAASVCFTFAVVILPASTRPIAVAPLPSPPARGPWPPATGGPGGVPTGRPSEFPIYRPAWPVDVRSAYPQGGFYGGEYPGQRHAPMGVARPRGRGNLSRPYP